MSNNQSSSIKRLQELANKLPPAYVKAGAELADKLDPLEKAIQAIRVPYSDLGLAFYKELGSNHEIEAPNGETFAVQLSKEHSLSICRFGGDFSICVFVDEGYYMGDMGDTDRKWFSVNSETVALNDLPLEIRLQVLAECEPGMSFIDKFMSGVRRQHQWQLEV